jgi:hypothetical protein
MKLSAESLEESIRYQEIFVVFVSRKCSKQVAKYNPHKKNPQSLSPSQRSSGLITRRESYKYRTLENQNAKDYITKNHWDIR